MDGLHRKPYGQPPQWWEYVFGIPLVGLAMFGLLWLLDIVLAWGIQ